MGLGQGKVQKATKPHVFPPNLMDKKSKSKMVVEFIPSIALALICVEHRVVQICSWSTVYIACFLL